MRSPGSNNKANEIDLEINSERHEREVHETFYTRLSPDSMENCQERSDEVSLHSTVLERGRED